MFAFPPLIDTKVDQPEIELVIDRDKVATLGLDMQTIGSDLGALVGGNYVNRFDLAGRSYKVIPQLERGARLNAGATAKHLRQRAGQPVDSRQHLRAPGKTHHAARVEPVPAVEFRQNQRRRHRAAGHRAEIHGNRVHADVAERLQAGLHRRLAVSADGRRQVSSRFPARGRPDHPGAGRAVQQLPRSVHHHSSARCRWRFSARSFSASGRCPARTSRSGRTAGPPP